MGAKNIEQGRIGVAQGVMKDKPLVFVVGGILMAPHPKRTAEERRADAKLVDRIVRHMS